MKTQIKAGRIAAFLGLAFGVLALWANGQGLAFADDPPACEGLRNDWVNDVRGQRRVSDLRAFRRRIFDRDLAVTCRALLAEVDGMIAARSGAPAPPQTPPPPKQAAVRPAPPVSPAPVPKALVSAARRPVGPMAPGQLDARTTPATQRAPIVLDPAALPDFALFRECDRCPEMVVIPAGGFLMGSPAGESGRIEDEDTIAGPGGVQLPVQVARFAIARFETTWEEWGACTAAGYCSEPSSDEGWGRGRMPVINVNWDDVGAYATFLNSRLPGGQNRYRRATEAEWEYAARADTRTRFAWGEVDPVCAVSAPNGANIEGCFGRTRPVGSYRPNPWGLYDMHGNVDEWVEDCDLHDSLAGTPINGTPVLAVTCPKRVLRSGSWTFRAAWNRSTLRDGFEPTGRRNWFGFRVARAL
jgi:formylglycine-generating enzyme required for sulfatase activity